MKRLLFINLFLLSISGMVTAQNHRISVDLLSPGLGNIARMDSWLPELHWYSLTYERKIEDNKAWGVRGGLISMVNVNNNYWGESVDVSRQVKVSVYKKQYFTHQSFGKPFIGQYASLSHLADKSYTNLDTGGRGRRKLTSGLHIGGGVLLGTESYLSKHWLIEFSAGLGIGGVLNPKLYQKGPFSKEDWFIGRRNVLITFLPSFLDINLCYEF